MLARRRLARRRLRFYIHVFRDGNSGHILLFLRSPVSTGLLRVADSTPASGDSTISAHANATENWRSKVRIADTYPVDIGHQTEYIQQPNDHKDHDNAIQYGLDRPLHGDQIDQPQQNPDH
jgi:hypothetical protein